MLTRKEKLIIKKVIVLIESGNISNMTSDITQYWSCLAIKRLSGKNRTLLNKYAKFYNQFPDLIWYDGTHSMTLNCKDWRLLCLETFFHLNGEIK